MNKNSSNTTLSMRSYKATMKIMYVIVYTMTMCKLLKITCETKRKKRYSKSPIYLHIR